MRIDGTSSRSGINRRAGSKKNAGTGAMFRPQTASAPKPAAPQAPVAVASGIEAILALQGVDNQQQRRKQAVRHGQSMLDTLEEMKADLLIGNISEGRLHKLMAMLTRARQQADPELENLIDDIDLRAQVELAKLGMFVK